MSNCCSSNNHKQQDASVAVCRSCGIKGKAVATLTVKQLVTDHTSVAADKSYSFCRTPSCDVVYFAPGCVFRKPGIKVRVGLKEKADPAPLCYCFGYTREDIRRDVEQSSASDIPQRIKSEIQAGFCACEIKNPSGTCCLGDITRTIQEFQETLLPTRRRAVNTAAY